MYRLAVDLLFATGYQVSDAEYAKLKNSMEEARIQADIARLRLDQHNRDVHSKAG